mmetsp:Transcript_34292/g.25370  ORF Transcript_34292/g.25370 Transcript_34292/m.25370 type:complete len:101 (+) Transcript_34292:448-750(+)
MSGLESRMDCGVKPVFNPPKWENWAVVPKMQLQNFNTYYFVANLIDRNVMMKVGSCKNMLSTFKMEMFERLNLKITAKGVSNSYLDPTTEATFVCEGGNS